VSAVCSCLGANGDSTGLYPAMYVCQGGCCRWQGQRATTASTVDLDNASSSSIPSVQLLNLKSSDQAQGGGTVECFGMNIPTVEGSANLFAAASKNVFVEKLTSQAIVSLLAIIPQPKLTLHYQVVYGSDP
jgi:hypothetical protein